MKFPVTRDQKHKTECIMLDAEDILYIDTEDRKVVFHTHEGKFYLVDMLTALAQHMEPLGFRQLDRVNIVNIKKVTHFDDEHSKVYFDREITKNSKYATVSFANKKTYKEELDYWIERNKNMPQDETDENNK